MEFSIFFYMNLYNCFKFVYNKEENKKGDEFEKGIYVN